MKVGITGTRSGFRNYQLQCFTDWLGSVDNIEELHHGDSIGVDVEAAEIAQRYAIKTVCHPPVDESSRAFHKSDVILPQKTHFARNRTIVDSVDFLIVVPWQNSWHDNGGTWYTATYAKKINKPFRIFYEFPNFY